MKPDYLVKAEKYLGLAEVPGKLHNKIITTWWTKLKVWFIDDETPWCGLFVAVCLDEAGLCFPKTFYRALDWQHYGEKTTATHGAIAVLKRTGGGHVAFVAGRTLDGRLVLLGGNQGNQVKYIAINPADVLVFRKPVGRSLEGFLPVIDVKDSDKRFS